MKRSKAGLNDRGIIENAWGFSIPTHVVLFPNPSGFIAESIQL